LFVTFFTPKNAYILVTYIDTHTTWFVLCLVIKLPFSIAISSVKLIFDQMRIDNNKKDNTH